MQSCLFWYMNKVKYFSIMLRFEKHHFEIFSCREKFVSRFYRFAIYRSEMWFWKYTFREVYISTFDGPVIVVLEKYCFETVGYDNILINVFIVLRKIVCAVWSFVKSYIRDFIRLKNNIHFGEIAMWEIVFQQFACLYGMKVIILNSKILEWLTFEFGNLNARL